MSEPIRRTLHLAVPVAHAFNVFTRHVDAWWPSSHRKFEDSTLSFEASVGGRFLETSASGEQAVFGEVRLWEPPHRVAYSWFPGSSAGPTEVDVRFVSEGEQTRVEITHSEAESGLGDKWPERVQLFVRAWDSVLPAFAARAVVEVEGVDE